MLTYEEEVADFRKLINFCNHSKILELVRRRTPSNRGPGYGVLTYKIKNTNYKILFAASKDVREYEILYMRTYESYPGSSYYYRDPNRLQFSEIFNNVSDFARKQMIYRAHVFGNSIIQISQL